MHGQPEPDIAEKTQRTLQSVQQERKTTTVLTSHHMNEVEELCGRIAFWSKGEILRIDTATHIKQLIPHQVVEVTFQLGTDIPAPRQLAGVSQTEQNGATSLSFVLDDPTRQLDPLLRQLTQNGGPIIDINVTRPTLEDVFIKVARGEL